MMQILFFVLRKHIRVTPWFSNGYYRYLIKILIVLVTYTIYHQEKDIPSFHFKL